MGWMLAEYVCEAPGCDRGRFEELQVRPAPREHPCPTCGAAADRVISAPKLKTFWVSADKGKKMAPPSKLAQDTEPLAEGMKLSEWRAQRKKLRDEARRERNRKLVEPTRKLFT